jgi:8-oxo-dGTP pyrophosphatase MutT (NUDIX family)
MSFEIVPVARIQFSVRPWRWPFSQDREAEIALHFSERARAAPSLWNGRVLLLRDHSLAADVLRGTFFETDFASFLAWRDWGFPESAAFNCFAMGAIRTIDGAYLLGEMGAHTSSAGQIYFPAGTPDPADIVEGRVDLHGSVMREVEEETGLRPTDYEIASGWSAVFAGVQIALMKELRIAASADAIRAKILQYLSEQQHPELSDIHIVRGRSDLNDRMPGFMQAYLLHALAP